MRYFILALICIFLSPSLIADKNKFPNHLLGVWHGNIDGTSAHLIFLKNGVIITLNDGELDQLMYQVSDCTDHCKLKLYKAGETESASTIIQFMEGNTMRIELTEDSESPPTTFNNFALLKKE